MIEGAFVGQVRELERRWAEEPRWAGIRRDYGAEDVVRLRGSVRIEHTLARLGAERLWSLLHAGSYVPTFGALTGAQAVQMIRAGLPAIYVSGWQVAADGNLAGMTYPDQSLYPSNSVPALVRRLNNALLRADQIEWSEAYGAGAGAADPTGAMDPARAMDRAGAMDRARTVDPAVAAGAPTARDGGVGAEGAEGAGGAGGAAQYAERHWLAPIVADAEAGFGGPVHAFELTRALIEAGAAGVHFEDQLAAEKKCGHMGGKVLVPTGQFIRTLNAARLAADVLDAPTLIVARTDSLSARLVTSDVDPTDAVFLTGKRTAEGYYTVRGGVEAAVARSLAYAPYADLLWFETSVPDLEQARRFAEAIHERFPGKLLAYNCSPSFNWERNLDADSIARFQHELADMGYRFQFITLAGWHLVNLHTYELAREFAVEGMPAYVRLQRREFDREADGYTATRHQREAGAGYYDQVLLAVTNGTAATAALRESTEAEQFGAVPVRPQAPLH